MDWNQEAEYIETQDLSAIPKCFNRSLFVFIKYCNMQYVGALKDKQFSAADRISKATESAFDAFHKSKREQTN